MATVKGSKDKGWLEFKYQATGAPIRFPVGNIYGEKDGPTLVVLGGMHGSEFSGIESAIRLYNEIDPKMLSGTVKFGMIYNLPAFENNLGFVVPHDGKNPMSTFPGSPIGTYGEAMAFYFDQEVLSKGDYFIELHGGDIPEALTPFVIATEIGDPVVDAETAAIANVYNIPLVVKSPLAADYVPHAAFEVMCKRGKPSILAESGQQGILNLDETETHLIGLRNVLKHLKMLPGELVDTAKRIPLDNYTAVKSELVGMWYPAVKLNQEIAQGQVVGCIRDYFGQHVIDVKAPGEGKVTAIRTSPAIKVGNVLVEFGRIIK